VPRRILSISSNIGLLLTRNDLLAVAGYSVASPRRPEDAVVLFAAQPFDIVLIGHSVAPAVRKRIIHELRGVRHVPILYVYTDRTRGQEPLADACIDVAAGDPEPLLLAIEQQLKEAKRAA
jgi:hypothetical protein